MSGKVTAPRDSVHTRLILITAFDARPKAGLGEPIFERFKERPYEDHRRGGAGAAVVPVRSAPFEIETLDLAAPLADEVLVRIVASGMCHTDLHARDGYFPNLPYPVACGHEGAGIIEQVGAAVTDLSPGDLVVISFPWCGECGPCRAERVSYCGRARPLKSSGRRADGSSPV